MKGLRASSSQDTLRAAVRRCYRASEFGFYAWEGVDTGRGPTGCLGLVLRCRNGHSTPWGLPTDQWPNHHPPHPRRGHWPVCMLQWLKSPLCGPPGSSSYLEVAG